MAIQKRIVDPVLTNLARAYKNAAFIGSLLFPIVPVDKEGGKIPQFGSEEFKAYNTERAPRAKSNRIEPESRSTIDFTLTEHDVEWPIDVRESADSDFNERQIATSKVQKIIFQRLEVAAADLAFDANQYDSDHKIGLTTTKCWDDTDHSTPIADLEIGLEAVRSSIGVYPNTLVLGAKSFQLLRNHPDIIDRFKYSERAIITPDMIAALFPGMIEKVIIGKGVKQSDAGVFSDIWGDSALLAYVAESQTYEEPSYGYTLRKKGYPQVDTYTENGGKIELVRNTDLLTVKIVGATAGYLISNTKA